MSETSGGPFWERMPMPDGLLLRRPSPADVDGVFAVHRDPAVYRHDPQEVHPDPEHTARFLAPMLAHWAEHGFGYWTVLVPSEVWPDGEPGAADEDEGRVVAGLGGIQRRPFGDRTVLNVYYRLAPAAQGRGIAGAVIRRSVDIAPFVAPGLDLVVRSRPANTVARHVAERAGFQNRGAEPGVANMQLLVRPADTVGGGGTGEAAAS